MKALLLTLGLLVFAPLLHAEQLVLTGKVVDARNGHLEAGFIASTPMAKPLDHQSQVFHRSARLPRPIGKVDIVMDVRFLAFSKKEVWFAVNTHASAVQRPNKRPQRIVTARAVIAYGATYRVDDLFTADGRKLSLLITPVKMSRRPTMWPFPSVFQHETASR